MSDINELLESVLKESGATTIIASPDVTGVNFDPPSSLTPEEQLDKIIESKKDAAKELLKQIPALPEVPIPTLGYLYEEITMCALFGLNGAAISLSAVYVEYALKKAIVEKNFGTEYSAGEWDRIEKTTLDSAIVEAKKLGLLDEKSKKRFMAFKDEVRNPYLHYNIKKITKGVRATGVKRINTQTREVEEVTLDTETDLILWPHAKKLVDKERLIRVLNFVCNITYLLFISNGEDTSHETKKD